jgi:LysR family transcriptional regulator, glycine cleavage system transcriptional activator
MDRIPPSQRLPSLDSLRAFEVAARHLNFTRAADELHVTQSALSHRIKALEEELGVALFRRLTRKLELTIKRALATLGRAGRTGPLTVTTLPSVAVRWLVPRLARFRALNPRVDVRVAAEPELIDLNTRRADIALRFGLGKYPGLKVTRLMGDVVFPVASPDVLARAGPITQPGEIRKFPLLFDTAAEHDDSRSNWQAWADHCGAGAIPHAEGLYFNNALLVLEAAARGLGAALARRSLVLDDMSAGRLVRLLPHEAPTHYAYFAVTLPDMEDDPAMNAFIHWLLAESQSVGEQAPAARSRYEG